MILFQIIDIFLRLDTFQRGQEALKNDFKHGIHDDAIETRSKLDKNSRKKKNCNAQPSPQSKEIYTVARFDSTPGAISNKNS